jgi:hypothetical protein
MGRSGGDFRGHTSSSSSISISSHSSLILDARPSASSLLFLASLPASPTLDPRSRNLSTRRTPPPSHPLHAQPPSSACTSATSPSSSLAKQPSSFSSLITSFCAWGVGHQPLCDAFMHFPSLASCRMYACVRMSGRSTSLELMAGTAPAAPCATPRVPASDRRGARALA